LDELLEVKRQFATDLRIHVLLVEQRSEPVPVNTKIS
jgi:hypothetical protein